MIAQIVGNYRLLRALGKGAAAEVYLGEHIHLQTYAALKVLHTQGYLSDIERQEFIKEAQIIAKLRHQHIVRVLDFAFTDQGTPFLVMEYAAYGSLRQRHPRGEQLPLLAIVAYLEQIGAALMYVHQAGVVHADVKPENMLLGDGNRLLLGDFGIATLSSRATSPLICGTPAYMPPEQIQRRPCAASDQYALAMVVYEWLRGQVPFQGKTPQEVFIQQIQAAVPPLRRFVPGLAPEVEQAVLRALAKDPAARFSDVAAFVNAFSQAVHAPVSLFVAPPTQPVVPATPSMHTTLPSRTSTPAPQPTQAAPLAANAPTPIAPATQPVASTSAATQPAVSTPAPAIQPAVSVPTTTHSAANTSAPVIQLTQPVVSAPTPSIPPTQPLAPGSGKTARLATPVVGHRKQGETLYALDLEAGALRALAWSPDGDTLAAGSDYQEVFLWEALTGEHKRAHRLHEHQIRGLAWSPRGRTLASACADQLIHLWKADESSPQPLLTYRGHAGNFTLGLACAVAWSPAGSLLASAGTDRTAQVWRASDGRLLCTCRGHSDDINALCWSLDGTQLATGSDDGSVRLWDVHSSEERAVWRHHLRQVYALAWSPDGTRLASAGEGSSVYVWRPAEIVQPRYTRYEGHTRSVYALAWSPDASELVSAGRDRGVQIWRANDGVRRYTYTGHAGSVLAVAWSPDGAHVATADEDGQVRVWQARV